MTDPLTAGAIATLIFTTAVEKLTELATEDARKQLGEKLKALRQFIGSKFQGKAKAALSEAEKGNTSSIETVSSHLDVAMAKDAEFAQQVRELAQEIQRVMNIGQLQGQNIQNISGGEGFQVNNAQGPVIQGSGHTINITN